MREIINIGHRMLTYDEKESLEDGGELDFEPGDPVELRCSNLVVTGVTQEAGKTTALEKMADEAIGIDKTVVAFLTKQDEGGFRDVEGTNIPPYFRDEVDWEYILQILEAAMKKSMKFEESWIINAVEADKYEFLDRAETLDEVHSNVQELLRRHRDKSGEHESFKLRPLTESVYTRLDKYFEKIIPKIQEANLSTELELHDGLNIMDLRHLDREVQALVIGRTLQKIHEDYRDTIGIIPEAWKFLPQDTGSPCKDPVETFVREASGKGDYLWIDSQDMTGVDKQPLKQVNNWILGYQREKNEVDRTRDQMPLTKRKAPGKEEVMSLKIGEFFLCDKNGVKKVYIDPVWIDEIEVDGVSGEELARKVARGEISSEQIKTARKEQVADRDDPEPVIVTPDGEEEKLEKPDTERKLDTDQETLEKKVSSLEERVEFLKQEMESYEQTIKDKDEKIEELQSKITELKKQNSAKDAEIERLRKQLDKPSEMGSGEKKSSETVKDVILDKGNQGGNTDENTEEPDNFDDSRLDNLEEKLEELAETVEELDTGEPVNTVDEEKVAEIVEEKLEELDSAPDFAENIFEQSMNEFQQQAIDNLMEEISDLKTVEKKIVFYMETRGKGISSKSKLAEKALGYKGNYGNRVKEAFDNLENKGYIRVASNSHIYPELETKVEEELEGYGTDEETIEDTYKRVYAELKQEVN